MAASHPSEEHRPLKKSRLGPPDVYPQDAKQKEDELNQTSVKLGFQNPLMVANECESEKDSDISIEKFGTCLSSIITKKIEINTLQDTKKRHQITVKDTWPAAKNKATMEVWFKDLAGSKPLAQLSRKVPMFNKKEEIFITLCEYQVPMVRAAWLIKMTAAHSIQTQETRVRRKQAVDPSQDWTSSLNKFLKDQLQKVQDHYHGGSTGPQTSFLTATQAPSQVDLETALKHWHFCCRLARHMFNEGLLDRHDFLTFLVDLMEKLKQTEDTVLKLVVAQILTYLDEITQSALLSRKLAYFCVRKLCQLCSESGCTSPRTQSPLLTQNGNGTMTSTSNHQMVTNPLAMMFAEYSNCAQHRGLLLSLSAMLQCLTLRCPTALVWNSLQEGKNERNNFLCGSPLDHLMCAPSSLPMVPSSQNQQIRSQIRSAEHQIKFRGRCAEVRWSSDKCQESATGYTMGKVLHILDILDRHHFDRVENGNSLDSLFHKIFSISQNKDGNELTVSDEPIVKLLIDWAVSTQRTGDHRAIVVAKLLERRQNEIRNEKYGDSEMMDDKDSTGSDAMIPPSIPAFQSILMDFLDKDAPTLDENTTEDGQQAFKNLIHLFCELIRHDVFSHAAYMCTLISRGDLLSSPSVAMPTADSVDLPSVRSMNESIKMDPQDDIKVDSVMDMQSMVEGDLLGSLFGSVKDEQKTSPEGPASVKSVKSEREQPVTVVETATAQPPKGPSRHMLYSTHFPIPQDEDSIHECNQRMIVLYGVGKARDEARHVVKKISKEIVRLYSKRNCIDVGSGDLGKVKKKKEKEGGDAAASASVTMAMPNFDGIFVKYQKLSYYDQHAVSCQCTNAILEQMNSFVSGSSSYLPLVENISYLFDLMEYSIIVNGLVEFVTQILKELCEVETQLKKNKSTLAGHYTTSLCLCIVGILRKYHSFLLVSEDITVQAFERLMWVLKIVDVTNPVDCTSSERCILAYLYDVYTSSSYLQIKFADIFNPAYNQMKQTLYAPVNPSASNLRWDPSFMLDLIGTGKSQPDHAMVKQLTENSANRYSFVTNAILNICNSQSQERLNEISVLCAELTARCNPLSAEWLGVLKALCCSSMHSSGFIDVLTQIDVSDLSIHDSLAVFTAILIARHCFSFQDLVVHVALPSLLAACPSAGGDQDAEPGARLTCHLLLRLFKTSHLIMTGVPSFCNSMKEPSMIKASCDCHLLEAAHDSITLGPVLAVLKAILVLGDSCNDESKSKSNSNNNSSKDKGGDDIIQTLLRGIDDDVDMNMVLGSSLHGKNCMESAGLSEFSKHALREMCRQTWVQEKFLKDPENLFDGDLLIDPMLSNKQAQQLLHMICYPSGLPNQVDGVDADNKQVILRILQTLDQWSLRVSWLELQLMFKQATTQTETNNILDNIAKETVELFHQQTENCKSTAGASSPNQQNKQDADKNSVWLVAPLISKLPCTIQGRVLKLAGQVLESGNDFVSMKSKMDKEKNQKSKSLLGHQPFLSLVLTCLKGQDEQREGLLNSLHSQLEKFINNTKELLEKYPDESKIRQNIHESLQLRLSLVGGTFDTIQRNNTNTNDWSMLLLQLISHGVVDIQTNSELFMTVIDMLSVLIHGTLISDGSEKGDETKKTYLNLIKRLRKELGEKHSDGIDILRQLLPLPKKLYEVITCEPYGTLVDTKGNKIAGFDSIGKKQGLQVAQKLKLSPWEVIEGHKNPAPISWSAFSAIKMEKKPLKHEEQHRLLLFHQHSMRQPNSYYLEAPNLPPEDLEPPPEKVEEKPVEKTEGQSQDSGKKPKARRQRKARTSSTTYVQNAVLNEEKEPPVRGGPYYPTQDPMYQPQGPHPNWMTPPGGQPSYGFQNQPMAPGRPRYPGNAQYASPSNSKIILHDMIQNRKLQPSQYPMGPSGQTSMTNMQHMMTKQQQQQLLRQQLLQKQNRLAGGQDMYNPMGSNHAGAMHPMGQPPAPSYPNQSYSSMPPQNRMMEQMGGNMMQPSYAPSYQGGQAAAGGTSMMPGMAQQPQQTGYMSQQPLPQPPPPQQQYAQQRMQPSISSGMQTNPGMSYSQMGGTGPPPQSSYIPQMSTQRMQQLRQSRMLQMQQQSQQQQQQQLQMQTNQQQKTAALVAQLQRQMPGTMQAPPGRPAPQYNQYQQY
ncbi:mediator of RNA polymerase II transcription subunit 12-like protein isoform X2 [Gigantopelta aegis]|uniref:mediator of RNA polymerase II transcription subunit 12-like protein isoform X2 n=1 Tax=Gigantopelta aegis TaxID=1735272 RepID=UPI001B88E65D|nr:mediator of RNA polymerase II transcription subunit 12-like protein isoform X2 [Gigantopelta aegis]